MTHASWRSAGADVDAAALNPASKRLQRLEADARQAQWWQMRPAKPPWSIARCRW